MNEAELGKLRNQLQSRLGSWVLGGALEDIVDDTLSRYWEASRQTRIEQPIRWMLRTAKYVRSEIQRSCSNEFREGEIIRSIVDRAKLPHIDLSHCKAWAGLTSQQQYVLRETIMFDRPVATVAREVGVKRSTAKSWKERLPRRLAGDPFIAQYLDGVNSSHLLRLCGYASAN